MDEKNSGLQIETSRSGHKVPVLNGIYLHSIYNPIKEANSFADSQLDLIKSNSNILVLGLGFGYHVKEIIELAKMFHTSFKIVVIEQNKKLVDQFKSEFQNSLEIVNYESVKEYFEDMSFSNFLTQKPAIIKHDQSFNSNKDFYINFLTYKAPTKISEYHHILNSTSQVILKDNLPAINDVLINAGDNEEIKTQGEYFLFALHSAAQSAQDKV